MTWRSGDRAADALLFLSVLGAPLAFGAVEPWAYGLVCILIASAALLGASRPRLAGSPLRRSLLPGMIAVAIIGALQWLHPRSPLGPASLWPSTASQYSTGRALVLWSAYALALWLMSAALASTRRVRIFLSAVFAMTCLLSLLGLLQATQGDTQRIYGLRLAPYPWNPFGPYYNRDHAASMLIMGLFCGLGLARDQTSAARQGRGDRYDASARAVLLLLGCCLIFAGLMLTRSLGALASFLLAAVALTCLDGTLALPVRLAVAAALIASPLAVARLPLAHNVRNGVEISLATKLTAGHARLAVADRLQIYRGAARLWRDAPWLGSGFGAFQEAYQPYRPNEVYGIVEHAHCDWLELATGVGIVGLALYAAALAAFAWDVRRGLARPEGRRGRMLAWGAGGAALCFALHGCVDFSFQTPADALVFLSLLACLSGLSAVGSSDERPGLVERACVALAAAAVIAASAQPALASALYLRLPESGPERSEGLRRIVPLDGKPRYRFELAVEEASEILPQSRDIAALRLAGRDSAKALEMDPGHPAYRYLQGSLLWRLSRVEDGRELIGGR